jgi:hypothetical protein
MIPLVSRHGLATLVGRVPLEPDMQRKGSGRAGRSLDLLLRPVAKLKIYLVKRTVSIFFKPEIDVICLAQAIGE